MSFITIKTGLPQKLAYQGNLPIHTRKDLTFHYKVEAEVLFLIAFPPL